MNSALIVSNTEKSTDFFTGILEAASISQVVSAHSCGEARRLLIERVFGLVIIDAPLRDESGEGLAQDIAARQNAQIILVVPAEHFDAVSAVCENHGILTIPRPLERPMLWAAIKLARAIEGRLARMRAENRMLKQKLEDVRIVSRAKCLLIERLDMSEQNAHRYIEKKAMDTRLPRRVVADNIIKTYDD